MKQSSDNHMIPMTSFSSGNGKGIVEDVYYYTNQIVNVIMLGKPDGDWFLIDCGMPKCGEEIIEAAENRFGKGKPPKAIFLTHGHFDHVGGIVKILEQWPVPVYAHELELPFLTGKQAYPEPDSTVEGGILAKLSALYPNEPIDITGHVTAYPPDGSLPELSDWRWIHTPGHAPGQVAFFREKDRILIAGDAFVTVRQDSFYKVLVQKREVHGPPRYLTTDWQAAWETVKKLRDLRPAVVIAGHGQSMKGASLRLGLKKLADDFDTIAIPEHGRFV
ncbi:MBL fold metallo-hydrolase [Pedobacter sp. Leaf194]|uniref:MBL fold metallo-hydrolase n=1 Tax=Pedobacter sp. Leaf194 TaxID=1736297 RepID=UPI00070309F0|nr:MBL fold metallo-hydrolase [Pedobacter sp. Leaf194]KQS35798.1 MBL fold metallo-hydrolase [Pedobacter sp. Leaf194]